jgi:hypothetical protein
MGQVIPVMGNDEQGSQPYQQAGQQRQPKHHARKTALARIQPGCKLLFLLLGNNSFFHPFGQMLSGFAHKNEYTDLCNKMQFI